MKWKKLGIVFAPQGMGSWATSHAMLPTPIAIEEGVIRVFITFCDSYGRGRPGFVDVAAENPLRVLGVSLNPVLDIGIPGTFDENGVVACSVLENPDGSWNMYYVGFELGTKVRYRLLTGLAVSSGKGRAFARHSRIPVLERSDAELYFRCGPHCVLENGIYRMWYVAGSEWTEIEGKSMPVYDIRYIQSNDGVLWPDAGIVQISISGPEEHGFGRPYVTSKPEGGFRMFYSVRRRSLNSYRLGYAESPDGLQWQRMDEHLNLDVTPGSYDSEAIMYAAPFQWRSRLYVFYNGNEFGRQGFAVAELEQE